MKLFITLFVKLSFPVFLLILLLFVSGYAKAEEPVVIRGRIIDRKKQPVPYSSVYISVPQTPLSIVKGAISNDKGEFFLLSEKNKSYVLKIMFLGYKELGMNIQTDTVELNLGDLVLEEMSYKMSEVVVRPPLQVTADKIIYNFEHDPNRSRLNLHDMLSKMPMIKIGPMGKIIVGSEDKTYIVLRKGREDALVNFQNVSFEEMLKRLPALGFTTFEIWTVIPPKYSKYDYVINIIPDPNQRLFGIVGSPEVYYNFDRGVLRTGVGGNGSADVFRITGGVKYEYMDAPRNIREANTIFYARENASETLFDQKETGHTNGNVWRTNLSASLDISKRQFITFNFDASFRDTENQRQIISGKMAGESRLSHSISDYTIKNEADSWSVGATYQLDFSKPDRSLNVSYLVGLAPSLQYDEQGIHYTFGTELDEKRLVKEVVESRTHRMQLDYSDQFFKNKLKFNAQAGYLMLDDRSEGITLNELTGVEDVGRYNRFEQDFHRIDGFVHFSYNVSKQLNISVKSNVDYLPGYNTAKSVIGTFEEYIKQKEWLFDLNGKLFYQFSIREPKKEEKSYDEMTPEEKAAYIARHMVAGRRIQDILDVSPAIVPNSSLRFEYMYRQRSPGVSQLKNYSDEQDPLYIKRGNPNLYPETYHTLAMSFSSWFINSLIVSFSFSDDKIVSQARREEDKIVQSFYNSGKTRDFSVGMTHPFFKNKISVSPDFSSFYTDFGDGNWKKRQRLNVNARYHLTISTFCNAGFSLKYFRTFNNGAEGDEDVFPVDLSMDISWAPRICGKQVFIMAGVNNVLQWDRRTSRYADMSDYWQLVETKYSGIPLYLSVRMTLGKFKVKPVRTTKSKASVSGFSTDKE